MTAHFSPFRYLQTFCTITKICACTGNLFVHVHCFINSTLHFKFSQLCCKKCASESKLMSKHVPGVQYFIIVLNVQADKKISAKVPYIARQTKVFQDEQRLDKNRGGSQNSLPEGSSDRKNCSKRSYAICVSHSCDKG